MSSILPIKKILKIIYKSTPENLQYFFGKIYANTITPYTFGGGIAFRKYWNEFCKTEHWNREQLEKLQWEKFKRLLNHSYENVRFYRNKFKQLGMTPEDIKSFRDLEKIPILTKEDIRNHFEELIADGVKKRDLIPHETGGSTGTPLKFYWDEKCYFGRTSAIARWRKFSGCDPVRDKMVWIGPHHNFVSPLDRDEFCGEYSLRSNQLKLASTNMSPNILKKYVEKIRRFKPKYIQGYATAVYTLAAYLKENEINDIKVNAILTSSEVLYPKQIEIIETVFEAKVFNRYGQGEEVATATECEIHNGMHIDMEKCLIEVVDDEGKQIFEKIGNIIGTNLENYAMPLIRYQINDLGQISLRRCPCGRETFLLENLIGRSNDLLITPDGGRIGSASLVESVFSVQNIKECQFVQESKEKVVLKIVPSGKKDNEEINKFLSKLRTQIGNTIEIEIKFVDSIPRTRGGKFKFIISKIDKT